jgi:membrane-anchored protein YejM (alkaline phosphatase superfamily)
LSGLETVLVWFSIVSYAALLTALAALVGGATRSATMWTLLLAASTLYLIDDFSYAWLSAHLNDTAPLLVQNLKSFESMRSKMTLLVATVSGFLLLLAAANIIIRYGMARSVWWSKPVSPRRVAAFAGIAALLVGVDRAASPHLMALETYEAKNRVLWQMALYTPAHPHPRQTIFDIESPRFKQMPDEARVARALQALSPADVERPLNIFLFVVDSLREDAVTQDLAPNLFKLKQASLPVQSGIASSNVTHISWFSMAHASNPIYWSVVAHQAHSPGAVPMRLLKRLGYSLYGLSCSSLEYFGFERSVFGDMPPLGAKIADQRTLRDPATDRGEGDVDDKVMARLGHDVETLTADSRAFFLVMLDSTHHDYSWSRRYQPKFTPFSDYVSVFETNPRDIEPLRNRYRNSVNFVDMLFGEFLRHLEARGLMDSSVIIVTGDHGEEFLEMGHLVHSSQLNRFQTRVPMMVYVPDGVKRALLQPARASLLRASHLDIFPTVFDALGLRRGTDGLLTGQSLLSDGAPRVAFAAMASSYSPPRVLLDAGDYKLIVEFDGIGKVGRTLYARRLMASKVLNGMDEEVKPEVGGTPGVEELRALFQPGLEEILVVGR